MGVPFTWKVFDRKKFGPALKGGKWLTFKT